MGHCVTQKQFVVNMPDWAQVPTCPDFKESITTCRTTSHTPSECYSYDMTLPAISHTLVYIKTLHQDNKCIREAQHLLLSAQLMCFHSCPLPSARSVIAARRVRLAFVPAASLAGNAVNKRAQTSVRTGTWIHSQRFLQGSTALSSEETSQRSNAHRGRYGAAACLESLETYVTLGRSWRRTVF